MVDRHWSEPGVRTWRTWGQTSVSEVLTLLAVPVPARPPLFHPATRVAPHTTVSEKESLTTPGATLVAFRKRRKTGTEENRPLHSTRSTYKPFHPTMGEGPSNGMLASLATIHFTLNLPDRSPRQFLCLKIVPSQHGFILA